MGRKGLGLLLTHSVTVRMRDFSYTTNKVGSISSGKQRWVL